MHHIEHGDATRRQDGRTFYRRNLIATLREHEVAGIGAEIAASKALPFRVATDGETVSGKFTATVQLSSGKFAIVEKAHEFTLGGPSSTVSPAARSWASCKSVRCRGIYLRAVFRFDRARLCCLLQPPAGKL